MKVLSIILLSLALVVPCFAVEFNKPEEKEKLQAICPFTRYSDQHQCTTCHELKKVDNRWVWGIKKLNPKRFYEYQNFVKFVNGEPVGYFEIEGDVDADTFEVFVDFVYQEGFTKVLIDIYSGGGSLFEGWKICSFIREMQTRGIHVTAQVRVYAGSAAFLVMVAGQERLVEPTAYLMIHELKAFDFLKVSTPTTTEDDAKLRRMLQDVINNYIAGRAKCTKKELDSKTRYKDWWMTGQDAVEKWGFADGYIK